MEKENFRAKSCENKKRFNTEFGAIRSLLNLKRNPRFSNRSFRHYECLFCYGWHLTSKSDSEYFKEEAIKAVNNANAQFVVQTEISETKAKLKAAKPENKPALEIKLRELRNQVRKINKLNKRNSK